MPVKFNTCILHIGTEKTGTTTLQHCMKANYPKLLEHGYLFPSSLGFGQHSYIAFYAADGNRRVPRSNPALRENINAYRNEVTREFEKEITAMPQGLDLIISSERCQSILRHPSEIERLAGFLERYCNKVRVVVYLRPQHELAISAYTTQLRHGVTRSTVLPRQAPPSFDYDALLDLWANVFGKERVIPRLFLPEALEGGDICQDFLTMLDLDIKEFEFPERTNESLSAEAQIFLRYMNQRIKTRKKLFSLLHRFRQGRGLLPSRTEAEGFLAQFSESNERVRQKWFPQRITLFDPDFNKYPDQSPDTDLSMDQALDIFAELWETTQAEIERHKAASKKIK
ncbi:sulfotransferase family protein [Fodinicurvata fenggangensis]|uniref:sulfotransferase family protein n=1 Tax=Fodinicurvata fenggangensis TaxID=1121830 RepID=UPI0004797ED4|nr:sulfotransferase family protein [Fodinicurvata fenggangensis]